VRWLVPDYLPAGKLMLLAGDGGHGKTTLTLHLAAALTTGRCCLGREYEPPPPAEVLLISCEDDFADTIVPRLLAAGADLSRVRRVDGVRTAEGRPIPFNLAHYERLAEELADRPGVRLVVIDPAGAYVGRTGVDDHKDSELRGLLDPLNELAARTGVTILLVKHLNKGVGVKAVYKVGGSAGYVNAVRASFVLVPHPAEPKKKLLIPLKFNIGEKPEGLALWMDPLPAEESLDILAPFTELSDDDRLRLAGQLFRPRWDGLAGMDADEAFAGGEQHEATRIKECADWLRDFLGDRAWPDREVEAAGEDKGFSEATLKRAKTHLRKLGQLKSRSSGNGGAWWNWLGEPRPLDRPTPYRRQCDQSEQSDQCDQSDQGAQDAAQTDTWAPEQTQSEQPRAG
jgi:hypothetical protein